MADQGIPPQLLAAMQNGNGQVPDGGPPQTPPSPAGLLADPAPATGAILYAIYRAATDSSTGDTRERAELAKSVLALAQALVILDPTLAQDGTPLDHQMALEQTRAQGAIDLARVQGETAIAAAKQRAAAPTPARSVQVRRDQHGRLTGASVSEQ